mgnify:CR=1 FL=1
MIKQIITVMLVLVLFTGCQNEVIDENNSESDKGLKGNPKENLDNEDKGSSEVEEPNSGGETVTSRAMKASVSDCMKEKLPENAEIEVSKDVVKISQVANYVCCADFNISYNVEGKVLKVYYDNTGETCKCRCSYDFQLEVPAENIREVKVYGIRYFDESTGIEVHPYELMASYPDEKEKSACQKDSDCLAKTCCHPRECVLSHQAPDCDEVQCTLECKGGTMDCGQGSCACVDGECTVEWRN